MKRLTLLVAIMAALIAVGAASGASAAKPRHAIAAKPVRVLRLNTCVGAPSGGIQAQSVNRMTCGGGGPPACTWSNQGATWYGFWHNEFYNWTTKTWYCSYVYVVVIGHPGMTAVPQWV